ncbi:MAG TPA: hypothetical protein VGC42_28695 [Kofleriaceae bacterium]
MSTRIPRLGPGPRAGHKSGKPTRSVAAHAPAPAPRGFDLGAPPSDDDELFARHS